MHLVVVLEEHFHHSQEHFLDLLLCHLHGKTAVGPTGLFAGGGAGQNPYGGSPTAVAGPGGGGGYYPGPATYVKDAVANTGGGGGAVNSGGGGTGGKRNLYY